MKIDEVKLKELWESGMTDYEMSVVFDCSYSTVAKYRKKLNLEINKATKTKKSKVIKEDLEELVLVYGLTDSEIGKKYGVYPPTIKYYREKYGIIRDSLKENKYIELSHVQKEVLFGSTLGDSHIKKADGDKNACFIFTHSYNQKEYVDYKFKFFSNFPGRTYEFLRKEHAVTGNCYNTYTGIINTNSAFNEFREMFYINNKKIIPIDYLEEYYTPLAMAIHYCDDGSCYSDKVYNSHDVNIATCSFSESEINLFRNFLLSKYNLETTIFGKNRVRIRSKSVTKFMDLIRPYIIPSMEYKIVS